MTGMAIAGRHVWLQNLPLDEVPDCGMGLNYMLDTLPFTQVLREVFYGSGECAEIGWTFLGLTMPGWTFIWYAGSQSLPSLSLWRPINRRLYRS